jgi:Na+/H+-dicarboxylate symporter
MLVPGNVVAAAAQGNMLGVLCFTAVFALALKQLRRRGSAEIQRSVDGLVDLARTGSEALAIVLRWIMLYAPVGVFALTALTFSTIGLRALVPFVKVHVAIDLTLMVLCAAAALLLHRRGVGAVRFIRAAQAPLVTALSTQSSAATLPAELACVQRELGVPLSLAGLAIPMAVSLMKVGSAVFLGVMAVFAAEVGGLALTPRRLALIMLATWIGSIATAPVSGGAMVQLTLVFAEADLPTSVIPLVAGIPFAGKLNTVMNVAGHLAVTALVSQREKAEHVAGVPVAQPA